MQTYIISHSHTGNICNYMLHDLKDRDDVCFIYENRSTRESSSRILRKASRVCARLQWKLRKKAVLQKILRQQSKEDLCVLVTNEAMQWLDAGDLIPLQSAGIPVHALLIDPISESYPSASCARALIKAFPFSKILTFDPEDARKYGWIYCNCLYSKFPVEQQPLSWELFYVGTVKDRVQACQELLRLVQENDVCANLKLLCFDPQTAALLPDEIVLDSYVPYPQLLNMMQSSRCIFDMTQKSQAGVTLRYYEAVVYNKKLLTNNAYIKDLPYYDPRFMRIYEDFSHIDWDWVKDSAMPEYNYDGRFSPTGILQLLQEPNCP